MELTQKELKQVATSRYWREKRKSFLVGFLIIVNLVALSFLGLYITGSFPYRVPEKVYTLDTNRVTIQEGNIYLNGNQMVEEPQTTKPNYVDKFYLCSAIILICYILYHSNKARSYGQNLLQDEISKEKAGG